MMIMLMMMNDDDDDDDFFLQNPRCFIRFFSTGATFDDLRELSGS